MTPKYKPTVIIEREAKVSPADIRKLTKAGYVVITKNANGRVRFDYPPTMLLV